MCLILFAYRCHKHYPLLVAANRDEYHERPAQAARFWPELPQLLAGRDLRAGGTWLGVARSGRFAALTNFREPGATTGERSRGELCIDFLRSNHSPASYTAYLADSANHYGGFNLVLWDGDELRYYSNQNRQSQALAPGFYGISNGYLDEAWPKVSSGKAALQAALESPDVLENCLEVLADRTQPKDHHLPETGVGIEFERLLAPRFILSTDYGTRVSTVLALDSSAQATFIEQSFAPDGSHCGRVDFAFALDSAGIEPVG
jgi:uncharacterized protein with NRDE domain